MLSSGLDYPRACACYQRVILVLLDIDTAAGDSHRIGNINIVRCSKPVVINDAIKAVQDLDPELVVSVIAASVDIPVISGQDKFIPGLPIYLTNAFVLGLVALHNERTNVIRRA